MQLKKAVKSSKKPQNIRDSLALATCSLLAGVAPVTQAVGAQSPWQIDGGLLIYAEKDRVSLVEPVLQIRKEIDDNEFFTARFVADTLTGASPNGAAPSPDQVQTFSSPSGNKDYTVKANDIPLDPTFKDTRGAVNVSWEKPLSERLRGVFGASFSTETDYTSFGVSASLAQDFNQRNSTLTAAVSLDADSISPLGGAPDPFSSMPVATDDGDDEGEGGPSESKTVQQYLIGVTQVLGHNTLTQLNYSYGHSDGYLTDPYKVLSVLANDGSGNLRATAADVLPYVYEKRPDARTFQTLYWKGIHQFGNEDVLTLAYRYGWDDWGINSHTYDVKYRVELHNGHYLQPHYRHYNQSAADFYRQTLIDGNIPDYASADSRLGELTTQTIGLKYGIVFDQDAEINFRVEYMHQTGKTRTEDAVGKLANVDLFPENEAAIVQVGISMSTDTFAKRIRTAFLKVTR